MDFLKGFFHLKVFHLSLHAEVDGLATVSTSLVQMVQNVARCGVSAQALTVLLYQLLRLHLGPLQPPLDPAAVDRSVIINALPPEIAAP
jgi:hypothetical protein